jgi:LemA protein
MKLSNLLLCLVFIVCGCDLFGKGIDKYDTLVDRDEDASKAWADYESTLQRRADLIPQLVSVVKGSAAHEEKTLTQVVEARANATRPEIKLDAKNDDFSDPAKLAAFQQAQGNLSQALGRLMMVQEQYPTLQANAAFHDLQVQIEGSENRILRAREEYNTAARNYNTELRHVSGKAINPLTGKEFKPRAYFTADDNAKTPPKIDFDPAPKASK